MAPERESQTFELDDLLVRPGTYFNPQTEVVVVVDDSASIDQEVFNMEDFEGADWVLISDEVPVDSDALDTAMERFQTDFRPAPAEPPTIRRPATSTRMRKTRPRTWRRGSRSAG